jgi:hypothetical protein
VGFIVGAEGVVEASGMFMVGSWIGFFAITIQLIAAYMPAKCVKIPLIETTRRLINR